MLFTDKSISHWFLLTYNRKEFGMMKKKLVLGAALLGAASMLCGFDNTLTANDVLQKMEAVSKDATSTTIDMSMNLDGGVNISDGTTTSSINANIGADYSMAVNLSPLAMQMDMDMNLSVLGQNENINLKIYAVTNDNGELEMYTYTEDSTTGESEWAHETDSSMDYNQLLELSNSFSVSDYSDWGLNFELAPEAVDVDGTECYLLSAVIDKDSISTMLSKLSALSGEDLTADEDVALILAYMEGIVLRMDYYVDTASFLPVSMHMDLNDSDLTTLNALVAGLLASSDDGSSTAELVLNDCSIDAALSYGDPVEVTIPEEALQAAQQAEAEDTYEAASDELILDGTEEISADAEVAVG